MTARDDILARLVEAQTRVIRADEACRGAANIKQHCDEFLTEAQKELREAIAAWEEANPADWTETEIAELLDAGCPGGDAA